MYNLKIYQICHDLIAYFATLTSKKSQLDLIFRTRCSIINKDSDQMTPMQYEKTIYIPIS